MKTRGSRINAEQAHGGDKAGLVDALCTNCGFCCNGVLFADVRLQSNDDAAALAAAGLPSKGKRRVFRLSQPCTCFENGLCAIYQVRPQRCRSFECGVLKRAAQGRISESVALRRIENARQQLARVLELLRKLGNHDESVPLRARIAAAARAPMDMSDRGALKKRTKLIRASQRMMHLIETEFLRV